MYRLLFSLLFIAQTLLVSAQLNLTHIAHIPNDSGITLSGCWHHVDSIGNEYALVGHFKGLDIYDMTIPSSPVRRFRIPGLNSNWREVKTWGGFAYIGSEATGSGITIVDMRSLPDTVYYKVWFGNNALENLIQRSHTVAADNGYLYVFGSTAPHNGAIICSLEDPWNPNVVGEYTANYLHDGLLSGDTLWGSEIYKGQFSVIDISDKTNPVILTTQPTPGAFNHNTALSKNKEFLFTTDEKPFTPLGAFEVSDLGNITQTDVYYPSQRPAGEVHNVRMVGDDYLVCPSYQGQLTVVDASDPRNLIETAWVIVGNSLVWDADPYLPSGVIFATAKAEGLFVFQPNYVRGARLEGIVTDASTGAPLLNAKVFMENTANADTTDIQGFYATGAAVGGDQVIRAEHTGYVTKILTQPLTNGAVTTLNIELQPIETSTYSAVESGVRIWPTIVNDRIWIDTPDDTVLEIWDAQGVLIKRMDTTAGIHTVLLPSLPEGRYQARTGRSTVVFFVKK